MEKDNWKPNKSCGNLEKINNDENNLDSSKQTEIDNINISPEKEKPGYHKNVAFGEERRVIKLRPRTRIQNPPSRTTGTVSNLIAKPVSDETEHKQNLVKTESDVSKKELDNSFASVGLTKVNYNVTLESNIVDRYTNVPVLSLPDAIAPTPESPETKKKRLEQERMKIAKQCRLHPSNKKYNQGPVVNPPLISPGVIVGYTPAGQRHQVDLNVDRPTWFNSEYARMQFDDATRINVSRMFSELENGRFLPSSLDPDIERRHFAEQELASKEAKEYFETCISKCEQSEMELLDKGEEYMSLLETEQQLIELNEFAVVKIQDFSQELAKRLNNALELKITPLMIIKNPIIVETMEKLSTQKVYRNVIKPAQALLNKIKSLFDVPFSQTFKQYFFSEVDRLKEKTKHMSSFDIFTMTEEPSDKSIESPVPMSSPELKPPETNAITVELPELQLEHWIPVENGDHWLDVIETNETGSNDERRSPSTVLHGGGYTSNDGRSDTEDSEDESEYYSDEELETDSEEHSEDLGDEEDLLIELVHGMIFHGYPSFIVLHFFEFI